MNFLLIIENQSGGKQEFDFKDDLKKMLIVAKTFVSDPNYKIIIIPSEKQKTTPDFKKKKRRKINYE